MRVALRDLNVAVTRKLLRQLEIARTAQNRGNKIMTEGVGGDLAGGILSKNFQNTFCYDISAGCRCDRLDLLSRAFIVPRKEGQGGQLFSRTAIQLRAQL